MPEVGRPRGMGGGGGCPFQYHVDCAGFLVLLSAVAVHVRAWFAASGFLMRLRKSGRCGAACHEKNRRAGSLRALPLLSKCYGAGA